ncbi:MAG: hypothetical protein ACP5XB_25200 [Isosphaeraceae bacterium]
MSQATIEKPSVPTEPLGPRFRLSGLLLRAGNLSLTPIDHVFGSAASTRRFIGYSFALLALLLAAMPTLGLAGLVVLHHALGSVR